MARVAKFSAEVAAERMQRAICIAHEEKKWPYFSAILGDDWTSCKFDKVEDYIEYAYERADAKFGKLPFRQNWEELDIKW